MITGSTPLQGCKTLTILKLSTQQLKHTNFCMNIKKQLAHADILKQRLATMLLSNQSTKEHNDSFNLC